MKKTADEFESLFAEDPTLVWTQQVLSDAREEGIDDLTNEQIRGACEQLQDIFVARAIYNLIIRGKVDVEYHRGEMRIIMSEKDRKRESEGDGGW